MAFYNVALMSIQRLALQRRSCNFVKRSFASREDDISVTLCLCLFDLFAMANWYIVISFHSVCIKYFLGAVFRVYGFYRGWGGREGSCFLYLRFS